MSTHTFDQGVMIFGYGGAGGSLMLKSFLTSKEFDCVGIKLKERQSNVHGLMETRVHTDNATICLAKITAWLNFQD